MTDMALIAGAVSSLNAAHNLAKAMLGIRDAALLQTKIVELQGVIMSAQSAAFAAQSNQLALLERVRDLEEQVAQAKARETEKQRYELHEPVRGCFVYALKPNRRRSEPAHWLCAPCYHGGDKSILQLLASTSNGDHYRCPKCGHQVDVPVAARTFRVMPS